MTDEGENHTTATEVTRSGLAEETANRRACSSRPAACPVCGAPLESAPTTECPQCALPVHTACAEYLEGCARYACPEAASSMRRARALVAGNAALWEREDQETRFQWAVVIAALSSGIALGFYTGATLASWMIGTATALAFSFVLRLIEQSIRRMRRDPPDPRSIQRLVEHHRHLESWRSGNLLQRIAFQHGLLLFTRICAIPAALLAGVMIFLAFDLGLGVPGLLTFLVIGTTLGLITRGTWKMGRTMQDLQAYRHQRFLWWEQELEELVARSLLTSSSVEGAVTELYDGTGKKPSREDRTPKVIVDPTAPPGPPGLPTP